MYYSAKICALYSYADSTNESLKKKFSEGLSQLLSNDQVINEINENSKEAEWGEKHVITWNKLFIRCHQVLTEDLIRITSSTPETIEFQNDCCALLSEIVRHSIQPHKIYLNSKDLLSAQFEILENDTFVPIYHTYLKILITYVRSNQLQGVYITSKEWKNILQIACRLYEKNTMSLIESLEILLPFFFNIIEDVKADPVVPAKMAFKLIYTVCKEIAIDCRHALCNFAEKIMAAIVSIDVVDEEKYKLLLFFVAVHCSDSETLEDNITSSNSSVAHDWSQWRTSIILLYKNILCNLKETKNSQFFIQLACEVFLKITFDPNYREIEEKIQNPPSHNLKNTPRILNAEFSQNFQNPLDIFSSKLSNNLNNMSDNLNTEKLHNLKNPLDNFKVQSLRNPLDIFTINSECPINEHRWFMTEILTEMIRKNPKILKFDDFLPLFDLTIELFTKNIKNADVIDSICRLWQNLLITEAILSDGKMFHITKKYWYKIWNFLLRILGLNVNEETGHELVQYLIVYIENLHVNGFLRLYVDNEIRWSPFSVNSLSIVCQHVNIFSYIERNSADESDAIKESLISWALSLPPYCGILKADTVEAIGIILGCLSLKIWIKNDCFDILNNKKIILNSKKNFLNRKKNLFDQNKNAEVLENIKIFLRTKNFEPDFFQKNEMNLKENVSHFEDTYIKNFVKPKISQKTLNTIVNNLNNLLTVDEKNLKNIHRQITDLSIVGKFISNLNETVTESYALINLQQTFAKSVTAIHEFICKNNYLEKKHGGIVNLMKSLITFYEASYHRTVAEIIIENCPEEFLSKLFAILNADDDYGACALEEELGVDFYDRIFELYDCENRQENDDEFGDFYENENRQQNSGELSDLHENKIRQRKNGSLSDIYEYKNRQQSNGELGEFYENKNRQQINGELSKSPGDKNRQDDIPIFGNRIVSIGAHKILSLFGCKDCGHLLKIQQQTLNNLLDLQISATTSLPKFHEAFEFLKSVANCRKGIYPNDFMEKIVTLINDLFDKWKHNCEIVKHLIETLPIFMDHFIFLNEYTIKITKLFVKFYDAILTDKSASSILPSFLKSLCKIYQSMPSFQFVEILTIRQQPISVIDVLLLGLQSPRSIVRFEAINLLQLIFKSANFGSSIKEQCFEDVKTIITDLLAQNNLLPNSAQNGNWESIVVSSIYTNASVIHSSGQFETQSLIFLLDLHADHQIPIGPIRKVLKSAINDETYAEKLIEMNLFTLMKHWITRTSSLRNFPWMLTCADSEENFYQSNMATYILIKLETNQWLSAIIKWEKMGYSYPKIIEDNIPDVLCWLVITLATVNDDTNKNGAYADELLGKLSRNEDEFKGITNLSVLIRDKLIEILTNLIGRFDDVGHFIQMFDVATVELPKIYLPNVNAALLKDCFTIIENQCPFLNNSMIWFLTLKNPRTFQQILLNLAKKIFGYPTTEYKLKTFHQYAFFCDFLLQKIADECFDNLALFFLRDTCNNLLTIIDKETDAILPKVAAKFFYKILQVAVASRAKEVSEILDFIVTSLINAIEKKKIDDVGLKILELLIKNPHESIKSSVTKLENLPTSPYFDELRQFHDALKNSSDKMASDLKTEMETFLSIKNEKIIKYHQDALIQLRKTLFEKKMELNQLYNDLENFRGTAEGSKSSLVHRLIYKLINVSKNTAEFSITSEVAKCLGELGPSNLNTLIFHLRKCPTLGNGDFEDILTLKIITKLIGFVFDPEIDLKLASSNSLQAICSSTWSELVLSKPYLKNRALHIFYLSRPFIMKRVLLDDAGQLNPKNCEETLNPNAEIWIYNKNCSYEQWLTTLTTKIVGCFDDNYFISLVPICCLNIGFCEFLLPKIIYLIMSINIVLVENISQCINKFFLSNVDVYLSTTAEKAPEINPKPVKCMLNIIDFIRIQCGDNFILKLNYLCIAKAAQQCSAYFSSIFYAEIFAENVKKVAKKSRKFIKFFEENAAEIKNTEKNEKILHEILRTAFEKIGDPDSIFGCDLSHLKDSPESRIQYYVLTQQWEKVADITSGNSAFDEMTKALQNSGFDYLLNIFGSSPDKDDNIEMLAYETAWRLCDWTMTPNKQFSAAEETKNIGNDKKYIYYHYQALKSLHERDNKSVQEYIDCSRAEIIKSFHNLSLECTKILYPKLVRLRMLLELEQVAQMRTENLSKVISAWNSTELPNFGDFSCAEPILSQRLIVYKMKDDGKNLQLKDALFKTYLQLADMATAHGHVKIAEKILRTLSKEDDIPEDITIQLQFHDALLSWRRNDLDIARYLMKDLITDCDLEPNLNFRTLVTYGNWMAESKLENPQTIIEDYYEKAISIYEDTINSMAQIAEITENDMDNLVSGYAILSQFAHYQYRQINVFMKGPEFESLKKGAKYAEKVFRLNVKDTDVKKALDNFQKQNAINVAAYKNIRFKQKMYFELTIKYLFKTLQISNKHNFLIFPTVTLWLENKDNDNLNRQFQEYLKELPTFKFISLIPQLVCHISNNRTSVFKEEIYKLIRRCVRTHPHHTLPNLLALVNTHKDYAYIKCSLKKADPTEKELGAKSLIAEFFNNKEIGPIIAEMQKLTDALIMLAYFTFDCRKIRHKIPTTQLITKIAEFRHCIVPTIVLNVDQSGDYSDIISIHKYEDFFDYVGGITAPKKIVCVGTDGVKRKQLIKGKDDLKQDAMIQQLFSVVNLLLAEEKECNRRKLSIRTYKIVPLSQRSGVLEWCSNTETLYSILTGGEHSKGLHTKYYPNDWSIDKCQDRIRDASYQSAFVQKMAYLQCCANLHPVLHFYFMEIFSAPAIWFERRLAYTRSVATNSMIGYILGLGDRHLRNILIDEGSGEAIHIDFGIAFEEGKETVPFRLTRNIEAVMGILGIEGVFRRSCEHTMGVLRNKKEIIITLLQVFLYDPLFSWIITPAKALELQVEKTEIISEEHCKGTDKLNKLAERALFRIDQKLQGTEDGLSSSVNGQVERLIQEAQDVSNLSKLPIGWQSYL